MKIKHIELMEQYAKQILKNLQSLAIKGTYSLEESLVYGFSESYFGDIYCVYCLEKDILTCFALFQSKVSKKTEDIILGDLEGLNKEVGGGYFYIDSILSRITFAVDMIFPRVLIPLHLIVFAHFGMIILKIIDKYYSGP